MLADEIPAVDSGCRELVEALAKAASGSDVDCITNDVQRVLSAYALGERLRLPEELRRPCADSYARRLIYRCGEPDFTILAMVWGPGQGTPVHDHSGMWCVEGVVEGKIAVTQYDLVEREGERCRFRAEDTIEAGVGSSGRLIPPFDYHTIVNVDPTEPAITIHVYGGEMEQCKVYQPLEGDWYLERVRQLSYSD